MKSFVQEYINKERDMPEGPRGWGEAIRRERIRRGLSQYEMADQIGVSPTNFSRLEKGSHILKSEFLYSLIVDHGFPLETFFPEEVIRDAAGRIA